LATDGDKDSPQTINHRTGKKMAFLEWRQVVLLLAKMKLFMLFRGVGA